ncbi:hypothetical protein ACFLXT_01835 [Chloroflexota bacterium]
MEQQGVVASVVTMREFAHAATNQARALGMPDLPIIILETEGYALSHGAEYWKQKASESLDSVVDSLKLSP